MALPSLLHPDKLLAWGRLAWDRKVQQEPVLTDRQCDGEKGSDKGARRGLAEEGDVWRPPRS